MIDLKQYFGTHFTIQRDEWTPEDADDLSMVLSHPKIGSLTKLLHRRMMARTEDMLNGKDSKDRIDELKDLILELEGYGNS